MYLGQKNKKAIFYSGICSTYRTHVLFPSHMINSLCTQLLQLEVLSVQKPNMKFYEL